MAFPRALAAVSVAAAASLLASSADAASGSECLQIETTFQPVPNLQIAVWVEDTAGNYVDTVYITRLTGTLGLGNRPGSSMFKSDFRFPYGRREMVLPVWAHKRDKRYGRLQMGGKWGNSMATCGAAGVSPSECDDETIGYHFMVSSPEPFFCSPRGGVKTKVNGVDVMTCASSFYGSKGAYAATPLYSLYPPRADLTSFVDDHDSSESKQFATINDLGAVSGATPAGDRVIDPLKWTAPGPGNYVLKIEAHLEGDFNAFHRHTSIDDGSPELNGYGKDFLGQPSVVYSVPFTIDGTEKEFFTTGYEGYSDYDGATGALHLPDMTISMGDGSGAGRLLAVGGDGARVKVHSNVCGEPPMSDGGMAPMDGGSMPCLAPAAPTGLTLVPGPSAISATFLAPTSGPPVERYEVRYRNGGTISDGDFLSAIPAEAPPVGAPGGSVSAMITGLRSETKYYVAARAISSCGAASPTVTTAATTKQAKFVTLDGCFIATAAYGTTMANDLDQLRRFRDGTLKQSAAGQLFVAGYYSFGPSFAQMIASDERLRAGARAALAPLVELARTL